MRPRGPGQVKELTGKVALVTGGAVRVGLEIARALADAGADVAVGYRRSAAEARAAVRDLEARGVRAAALRRRRGPAARGARARLRARCGGSAVSTSWSTTRPCSSARPLLTTTPAQFDRLLAVNLPRAVSS